MEQHCDLKIQLVEINELTKFKIKNKTNKIDKINIKYKNKTNNNKITE